MKIIFAILSVALIIEISGCDGNTKTGAVKNEKKKEFSTLQSEKEIKEKEAAKLKKEIQRLKTKKDSLNHKLDSLKK